MGVHAGQLALKSDLRLVQEYRRSLLPCLEQARRPTLDHHVYRSSGLGVWVLISENWYNLSTDPASYASLNDPAALAAYFNGASTGDTVTFSNGTNLTTGGNGTIA